MSKAKIGIVTVSDRASAGIYEDLSGKAIIDTLNRLSDLGVGTCLSGDPR